MGEGEGKGRGCLPWCLGANVLSVRRATRAGPFLVEGAADHHASDCHVGGWNLTRLQRLLITAWAGFPA